MLGTTQGPPSAPGQGGALGLAVRPLRLRAGPGPPSLEAECKAAARNAEGPRAPKTPASLGLRARKAEVPNYLKLAPEAAGKTAKGK